MDEREIFTAGSLTMKHVFEPSGLTNLSDMQAVLNAIETALEALTNPWQPIESAPRDGSWVLLTGGTIDYGWDGDTIPPVVIGQSCGESDWQFAWYDCGYYGEYENPTHWQPLPTPPEGAE